MANTFHKRERLCSKKKINLLFDTGKAHLSYPLKTIFLQSTVNSELPAQAMFIVPKRQFKKAHDRNKIKRRMREAYRLNKNNFYEQLKNSEKKFMLAFIYVGKKMEDYSVIEKALLKELNAIK